ncbi:MAG: sugar-binding protein [Kiritimatiellia bacterium]|jgi:hypothetical protein
MTNRSIRKAIAGVKIYTVMLVALALGAVCLNGGEADITYFMCIGQSMTLGEMASAGINTISHVPFYPDFAKEAAGKYGIRVCPYVDMWKVVTSSGDALLLNNPYWREVDADTTHHPEWLMIDENGKVKRPYWDTYHPGFQRSCTRHQSLTEAQIRGVLNHLSNGCGGVFIDNAGLADHFCWGEKYKLHDHPWPKPGGDGSNRRAKEMVFQAIKQFDPDKLCIINTRASGDMRTVSDAYMRESYIYASVQRPGTGNLADRRAWLNRNRDWKQFSEERAMFTRAFERGRPVCQNFFHDPCTDDEAAFHSFVWSKLWHPSIIWCAALHYWYTGFADCLARTDAMRVLYRIHNSLGDPLGEPAVTEEWGYRWFDNACLVINGVNMAQTLKVPVDSSAAALGELFTGEELTIQNGSVVLDMPPQTGRIIMPISSILSNYLCEIRMEAETIRRYLQAEQTAGNQALLALPATLECLRGIEQSADMMLAADSQAPDMLDDAINMAAAAQSLDANGMLQEPAHRLLNEARNLTTEDIKGFLRLTNCAPASIEIFRGGTNGEAIKMFMRSAMVSFTPFTHNLTAFLPFGEDAAYNLHVGQIFGFGASGETRLNWNKRKHARLLIPALPGIDVKDVYLRPDGFLAVRKTVDTPARQEIEAEIALAGHTSNKRIDNYRLLMKAGLETGLPFLNLEFCVVDDEKQICEAELRFDAGRYPMQVDSVHGAAPVQERNDQHLEWVYFMSNPQDRWGVLFLGDKLNFSQNTLLGKGQLKFAVAPLVARAGPFLEERIRNIRDYSSRVLSLTSGMYLKLVAPDEFWLDATNNSFQSVFIGCSNYTITSLEFAPEVGALGMRKDMARPIGNVAITRTIIREQDNAADFVFETPEGYEENDFISVRCRATATLDFGKRLVFERYLSRRLKYSFNATPPVAIEPLPEGGVKFAMKIKTGAPLTGAVHFAMSNAAYQVRPDQMDISLDANTERFLEFDVAAPSIMPNQAPVHGAAKLDLPAKTLTFPFEVKCSPVINIRALDAKIVVDGEFNEPAWEDAECAGDFVNATDGAPAAKRTEARTFYTSNALYIGFKCYDEKMKLKVDCARSNSEFNDLALKDDSIEIYVRAAPRDESTDQYQYVRFACNSDCVKRERGPSWNVAAARKADHWTVEVEIPFKSLGAVPRQSDFWGINFCRNNPGLPSSSWSYTHGTFANPKFFGWARFE